MRVLHIVAGLWKESGGPSEVIPNLCLSIAKAGHDVTILTVYGEESAATLYAEASGVEVIRFKEKYCSTIRFVSGLKEYLDANIKEFDIIHNHGHWLYPNWMSMYASRRYNVPLVTTPHGTLVDGMLRRSSFKKYISWFLFDRNLVNSACKIHALTEQERLGMQCKLKGAYNKTVVIPNGVFLPDGTAQIKKTECKRKLLFLSRINEIKGIYDLLDFWSSYSNRHPEWTLSIAGPVTDDVRSVFLEKLRSLESVEYLGPLYGKEKYDAFSNSTAFILPSYAERLPTAILEAASFNLPIVCTTECNFSELTSCGGAISFDAGLDNMVDPLLTFLSKNDDELLNMGSRAYSLIERKFMWDVVATSWIELYKEVIDNEYS